MRELGLALDFGELLEVLGVFNSAGNESLEVGFDVLGALHN